jgi:hypothetical protein
MGTLQVETGAYFACGPQAVDARRSEGVITSQPRIMYLEFTTHSLECRLRLTRPTLRWATLSSPAVSVAQRLIFLVKPGIALYNLAIIEPE